MKPMRLVWPFVLLASTNDAGAVEPGSPLVNEPPVPLDAVPGGPSFTLMVNGTGFVSGYAGGVYVFLGNGDGVEGRQLAWLQGNGDGTFQRTFQNPLISNVGVLDLPRPFIRWVLPASLTGVGQDFSLAPGSPATATISPGQAASYKVVVAPGGGFTQTVALSCSGAPAQSTCSVSPSSVTLDRSAATATVTVTTAGGSAGLTRPIGRPGGNMFASWLALSGTLGLAMLRSLAAWRREPRPRLLYGLAFLCLLSVGLTMSACGGGSSGNRGGGGTQAGTYNLTVTGTFTSGSTTLTHTTKLTLLVQ
jgi:hypothetical protein